MDASLTSLYQNRIIDLERRQRDIRARRDQEQKSGRLTATQERKLAAAYYIAHKEESRVREKLGYGPPRPMSSWVRKHMEDSLLSYIAFGTVQEGTA